MNPFVNGLRAAFQAARGSFRNIPSTTPLRAKRTPQFQIGRFASRYSRFGDRPRLGQEQQQWSRFGPAYRAQYIWRNYQKPIIVVSAGGGVFYVYNLEEVPITHRRRFNLISPEAEKQMFGDEAYNQLLQEYRGKILGPNHPATVQAARVVERLLPVTKGLAGDEWRVHVIDDPAQKNAFVIPGGKVFVFTGILKITKDDAGLAAVLGHEIAHNVAHHMAERASRSSIVMIGAYLISFIFDVSGQFGGTIANFFLSLPNSRTQEVEADHIGLLMMAEACYDPQAALGLWQRMKEAAEFEPPQFISTHPSNYNRITNIQKWLPDAQRIYDDTDCGRMSSVATAFQDRIRESFGQPFGGSSRGEQE